MAKRLELIAAQGFTRKQPRDMSLRTRFFAWNSGFNASVCSVISVVISTPFAPFASSRCEHVQSEPRRHKGERELIANALALAEALEIEDGARGF